MRPGFETFRHGASVETQVTGDEDGWATREIVEGSEREEYGWRLVAGNGEKVAGGEGYTRREDAERGARDVVRIVVEILAALDPEAEPVEPAEIDELVEQVQIEAV